jgi:hypothetical protein
MNPSAHLLVLFSIVIGLGLADLLLNARAIVFREKDVAIRLHPVPLLWALFALLNLLQAWWGIYAAFSEENYATSLVGYLSTFVFVIPMYLLASAALPSTRYPTVDLPEHYRSNFARIFGWIAALWSLSLLYHTVLRHHALYLPPQMMRLIGIATGVAGALTKWRWLHVLLMCVQIGLLVAFFALVTPRIE